VYTLHKSLQFKVELCVNVMKCNLINIAVKMIRQKKITIARAATYVVQLKQTNKQTLNDIEKLVITYQAKREYIVHSPMNCLS
jgi:hypothetical protein